MKRATITWLALVLCSAAGCQQEVISVHNGSLAQQFAQLNKQGWQVGYNDPDHPNAHKSQLDDPNVHVIKGADFSGVKFNTNFQIDDPKLRAQMQPQDQNQGPPPPAPQSPPAGMSPFGPAPLVH